MIEIDEQLKYQQPAIVDNDDDEYGEYLHSYLHVICSLDEKLEIENTQCLLLELDNHLIHRFEEHRSLLFHAKSDLAVSFNSN